MLCANGEALVGDLVMGGPLGGSLFGRRPRYHYFIEDVDELHASIRRVLDLRLLRWHVGHGGPLAPWDVERRLAAVVSASARDVGRAPI